jgi:hypothetical protein
MGTLGRAIAIAIAIAAAPTNALAQSPAQMATRRALLDEAQRASEAGNHIMALASARHAAEIRMTPSVRLFIAQEEAALNQFGAALGDADLCLAESQRDATLTNRDQVVAQCREVEANIRAHAGRVVVDVPDPRPSGLRVIVGGEVLDPVQFGAPVVVAPGNVVVEANATGRTSFRQEVAVTTGSSTSVHVVLPEAAQGSTTLETHTSTAASAAPTTAVPETIAPPIRPPPPSRPFFTTARIVGIGVALVGIGVTVTGAAVYAHVDSVYNACAAQHGCTAGMEPRSDDTASVAAMWIGGGLTIVGVGVAVVVPMLSNREQPTGVTGAWVDPRGVAGIAGRF